MALHGGHEGDGPQASVLFTISTKAKRARRRLSNTSRGRSRGIANNTIRRSDSSTTQTYTVNEWLMGCLRKSCGSCGDCLTYTKTHGKVE
ncbi:MAG: hypothetical protein ACKPKO_25230, partial [Candidatus Fonsibacter sp.]